MMNFLRNAKVLANCQGYHACPAAPCLHTHTCSFTHTQPLPSSRLFRYIVVYFIRRYAPTRGEPFDSVLTRTFYETTTMRRCSLAGDNNYSYRNRFYRPKQQRGKQIRDFIGGFTLLIIIIVRVVLTHLFTYLFFTTHSHVGCRCRLGCLRKS